MDFKLDNNFIKPLVLNISDVEIGSRPKVVPPDPQFLILLTEKGMRKLVSDHYDLLVKSEIKHLFPQTKNALDKAKKNSADFFIQICGGYPYFQENRGKPMLGTRHMPFKITPSARKIWLECYKFLLPNLPLPAVYVQSFWDYIHSFSIWIINTPEYK